ncbi:MAG: glycerophosphodiester phosphodiesterase [Rickettsiales bacterium]|nr:glycerophosphodiester phosphodiesterase [Pseudomonadota bacterium]MDA0965570.1 glycerophosphodiester phosphodiesterase [Pseudomonadota bacterium]MDG4542894.1 glycerophosphodiester phosphodiesterase [Rickettsiales bacterium]MDG4544658.1 glycerophosphodiester phosphodiesterase [Rickettsiales bacterium]MDG4546780.1 glycerophosphodiester phosphodiesterase [Rickettsiales bacterium]
MKHLQKLLQNGSKIIWHKTNSVQMMLEAVKLERYGVSGVEFDVVGTSDSVPFLMHDKVLTKDLMSDGEYKKRKSYSYIEVGAISAEELREKRPDIDSLREGLEAVKSSGFSPAFEFHLEIKSPDNKLVDNILHMLADYPKIDSQTAIRSFQESVLQHAKKQQPERQYCLLLEGKKRVNLKKDFITTGKTVVKKLPDINGIEEICGFKPDQVSVHRKILTPDFIENMQENGIDVEIYTLNDIKELKSLENVDRITTDVPLEIHKYINKAKPDERCK